MPHCPVSALLEAAAGVLEMPALDRLAARLGQPLRVGVAGRPGAGRRTVVRALRSAGVVVAGDAEHFGSEVGVPAVGVPDVGVYVFTETLTPEDRAAVTATRHPVVAVLNKAELIGVRSPRPLAAAEGRCRALQRETGAPVRPLAALLAVAGCAPGVLDDSILEALRVLTVDPNRLTDSSRRRLAADLDLVGTACAAAAVSSGARRPDLARTLRDVSGLAVVLGEIDRAAAPVRYGRLLEVLGGVAAGGHPGAARFLGSDAVVLARMAAAAEVVGHRPPGDRPDHLREAVRWQRYSRGPVSALHRACAHDVARGSLRLWARDGGVPLARV